VSVNLPTFESDNAPVTKTLLASYQKTKVITSAQIISLASANLITLSLA
jgi:hypothetical protein